MQPSSLRWRQYQRRLEKYLAEYRKKDYFWQQLQTTLTLLTLAFLLVFAIRPTVVAISRLVSQIKQKERINQQMTAKINQIIAAQEVYARYQSRSRALDEFLPTSPQLAQAAGQLLLLLTEEERDPKSLSLASVDLLHGLSPRTKRRYKLKGPLFFYQTNFSLQGNYEDLLAFIDEIKHRRRMMTLESYRLNPLEEGRLGLTGIVTVYFWQQ